MHIEIDEAIVEALKRDIAHHLPDVKSSHRVEAMARGLGFDTNAALRAAIPTARSVAIDGAAFKAFLTERGYQGALPEGARGCGGLTALDLALLGAWMVSALTRHPTLNRDGLMLTRFGEWRDGRWSPRRMEEMLASPEGVLALDDARKDMLRTDALAEFAKCLEFLSRARPLKVVGRKSSGSYGCKHAVERWWSAYRKTDTGLADDLSGSRVEGYHSGLSYAGSASRLHGSYRRLQFQWFTRRAWDMSS